VFHGLPEERKESQRRRKNAFVHAVLGVAGKPSVLHPSDPGFNRYDDLVEPHLNAMMAQMGSPQTRVTALGRLGEADDVGAVIAAVLSDDFR